MAGAIEVSRLGELIQANPGARSIVIDGNAVAPTYWVVSDEGSKEVGDAPTVHALLSSIRDGFEPDDEVALTSAGVVVQQFAIDGVGQIILRYARGASPSAVINIDPPQPSELSGFGIPTSIVDMLVARPVGLVLVGGDRASASDLARALYLEVARGRSDLSAAVIADRPLARSIARTPLLWLRRDARAGITRVGDAAAFAESFAKLVLLDISGDAAGVVPSALRLADAGALAIVVAPGSSTHTLLERWRVGATALGAEATWVATLSHFQAVITAETITGRYGPVRVCEWIINADTAVTRVLAQEGTNGIGAIFSSRLGGSTSREVAIDDLRGRGLL